MFDKKTPVSLRHDTVAKPVMLQQLFERTADTRPENIAVICDEKEYTYLELEHYANRIAHYLQKRGVKAGNRIGILLKRSIETYAAIIAVLKLGAAYVPLDTGYPSDRIRYITEDAELCLLISTESISARNGMTTTPVVLLDREKAVIASQPAGRPELAVSGRAERELCYIIYTSGSTGRPKGVEVEHRSVVNLISVVTEIYDIRPEDRVFQGITIAFDFSIEEIWMTFNAGATLVAGPADEGSRVGNELARFLTKNRVTVLGAVPTMLSSINEEIPSLRLIEVGGEACPQNLVARWAKPGRRFLNTYGPTETTITATWAELKPGKPVTIGRPLPSYKVFIANEAGQRVPNGEIGEIYIGGVGVARGYVKRPDITAERFIPDPEAEPGSDARLYRTGDLGRYIETGEIEYHGRADQQVKLRGYRIELSEIESIIQKSEDVQAAAVAVVALQDGFEELVAYVTPRLGHTIDPAKLHDMLHNYLPPYMVPAYIELVDALPILCSGKINRKALPKPGLTRLGSNKPFVAPAGEIEALISEIWRNVLRLPQISATDDFFRDLGGHSLFAAFAVSKLRENPAFAHLSMADFYANPTVQKLARLGSVADPNGITVVERPKTATSKPHASWILATAQSLSLYAMFGLPGLMVILWLYMSQKMTGGATLLNYVLIGLLLYLLYIPASVAVAVAAKRLLIGRFKPGVYPLWGDVYLCWWLVNLAQDLVPLFMFTGTPLMIWYCRLMGARIGKDCYIGTSLVSCHDLISLGDGTSIGFGSYLLGYSVTPGSIEFGTIDIGSDCFVGANSVLGIGTIMGGGAMLLEQSQLAPGSILSPNYVANGSPARSRPIDQAPPFTVPVTQPRKSVQELMLTAGFLVSGLLFLPLVPLLAVIPGVLLVWWLIANYPGNAWIWVVGLISAGALFVSSLCIIIAGSKRLILPDVQPGEYPLQSTFFLRKWTVDKLVELSLMLNNAQYGTLYIASFLRMLGAKIGARGEISTVSNITPELLTIKDEAFLADMASIGPARVYRGRLIVAPITIGVRTFIGNAALMPAGGNVPDGCLIGVQSTPPQATIYPGSSWLGLPPMYLPRRQVVKGYTEEQTFRPGLVAYALRYGYEFFRMTLPPAFAFGILWTVYLLSQASLMTLGLGFSLPLLPLFYLAPALAATLTVAALKWVLIGRYRPRFEPLWSHFVRRTELITGLYENVTVPLLLGFLLGTPFVRPVLRLLGVKLGSNVLLLTTFMSEFDLTEVGDNSAINPGVSLQTHLFEDRVMKMSHVRVGPDCTIGERSVVLYDSEMKSGASLGNLSLLMKGEVLAEGSDWEGSPAQPTVRVESVLSLQAKSKKPLETQLMQNLKHSSSLPGNVNLRKSV
jgi:non-ribosomal peptide synthetase-like protein